MSLLYVGEDWFECYIQLALSWLDPHDESFVSIQFIISMEYRDIPGLWMQLQLPISRLKVQFREYTGSSKLCLMTSCLGIGWLVAWIALLAFLASMVTQMVPSCLGTMEAQETHGAGSSIGCSSITSFCSPSLLLLCQSFLHMVWPWPRRHRHRFDRFINVKLYFIMLELAQPRGVFRVMSQHIL